MRIPETLRADPWLRVSKFSSFFAALVSMALFLLLGLYCLRYGHPHEDAYILFIYSELLSETGSISYFSGGPPAEGATDFLWMLAISALLGIGLKSAYAALFLNALGVFTLAYLTCRVAYAYGRSHFGPWFVAFTIPIYETSQAAICGFSVSLYTAVVALLYVLSMQARGRWVGAVAPLALALGLFRPDGVIIGAATCAALYFFLDPQEKKIHMVAGLISALAGTAYFLWRWNYFGHVLPLPLLVKSSTDQALPGLSPNLAWIQHSSLFLGLALFGLVYVARNRFRAMVMATPLLIHLFALTFAVQSQNISMRFQAPASAIILLGVAIAIQHTITLSEKEELPRKVLIRSGLAGLLLLNLPLPAIGTFRVINTLTAHPYINYLPYHLAKHVREDTSIAMTEAGRFAYWLDGTKVDLVGLNTARTATDGASVAYLNEIDPDIVFFHHAHTMPSLRCPLEERFCEISGNALSDVAEADDTFQHLTSSVRVLQAPSVATKFLVENKDNYTVFAVKYHDDNYFHVYGLKNTGNITVNAFTDSMERALTPAQQLSYYEMVFQQ